MINKISNQIGEEIARFFPNTSMLDNNNILWKIINNEWVGKRGVYTFNNSTCWLEDVKKENVKLWLCGKNADYNEIFHRAKLFSVIILNL